MKILILGSKGMLGGELVRQLSGEELFQFDSDLDVTDRELIQSTIEKIKPEVIFNCVAYNSVDKAEGEDVAKAQALNADAVGYIAEAAEEADATLVHYSTGFVFDGMDENGYSEDDQLNPQSVYARTKAEGEKQAAKASKHYIVRLNLLFGQSGASENSKKSFPDLTLRLAKNKTELDMVADEISTPTYAPDLAKASIELVKEKYPHGIYHLPNDGRASWREFAEEIFRIKDVNVKINPVPASKFPRPAKRPRYSVINNNKFPKLRSWKDALKEFLETSK